MERSSRLAGLTKAELARRRQREIEDAWGGLSLDQAINSSKPKTNTSTGTSSRQPRHNEAISMQNDSDIDAQMDHMSQPHRLAENLYRNFDMVKETNTFEDEMEDYMKEYNDQYAEYDEDNKDGDYWDEMYHAYNRSIANPRPARGAGSDSHARVGRIVSQDDTPIQLNPNGQYNLNFIDWNNEWERAYEAMEQDGRVSSYI